MRHALKLLLFFLFALPTPAQVVQSKVCPYDLVTLYAQPCTFDNPVTPGDLLVVVTLGGCNPAGYYECNTVSDSQQNAWKIAVIVPFYNGVPLYYALDVAGGVDTVLFAPNADRMAIIAEYPPSSGLDDANYGTYQGQNPNGDAQGQSSDFGSTKVVNTSQSGDLLITWGWSGGPPFYPGPCGITESPGYTFRGCTNPGLVLEDGVSEIPGIYIGTIHWGGYAHWVEGVAAFKMKTPLTPKCK
jgi:hypothetical protein